MKGNFKKTQIGVLVFCLLLPFFVWSNSVNANEQSAIQIVNVAHDEETVISVDKLFSILIDNKQTESKLVISNKSENLYEKIIPLGYIEKIQQWDYNNKKYVVVEYRISGSGSILTFDIFSFDTSGYKHLFQSNEYDHGNLVFNEGNQFTVSFPKYKTGDSMAMPSLLVEESYAIDNDNQVILNKEIEKEYRNNTFSTQATGPYKDPSPEVINKYLTDAAKANGVPPEVFKAIVWQESNWRQFNASGYPLIGYDGRGLGITQVTYPQSYLDQRPGLEERLKTDTQFNISEGIKILKEKWNMSYIPKINDNSPEEIEHWYFAILAYNGYSLKNDPRLTESERLLYNYPKKAYQNSIYEHMTDVKGQLNVTPFPINQLVINYSVNKPTLMDFSAKKQYDIPGPFTTTKHSFTFGNVLATRAEGVSLRSSATSDSERKRYLLRGESVELTGGIQFAPDKLQHFGWYPVKTQDGNVGYVPSSYLRNREGFLKVFPDLNTTSRGYKEVATLVENNVISGYSDATFRPDQALSRLEAAILFVKELGLDTTNVTNPNFKDISTSNKFYPYVAAVQNAGIFLGDGKGNFNGTQKLTRGEMAAGIVRAYDFVDRKATPFTDISGTVFKPSIESIYTYKVTSGISETLYAPRKEISRRDFSIFLFRSTITTP
ncbi:S-layer homology domain-containing protein [Fictibacillus nanhaiensis]|uniref:S-layer homology domain-containing protein n=1 Tax=Fictibacillus nanhaiensis TaxID=742169 RepID=UPI003C274B57